MASNLPIPSESLDSAVETKRFFETYGQTPLEFAATDVDACLVFFKGKGFDDDAALSVTAIMLKQAKEESLPILQILGRLNDFTGLQLSTVVAQILNNDRTPISTLGYKQVIPPENKIRDIAA
jgi:hypothetical protein